MTPMQIDGKQIGGEKGPYVIAELSGNHNGSKDRALALVEAAAKTGVDAIKLQTYTADTLTIDYSGDGFVVGGGLWAGRTLYELYEEAHTPWEWHAEMFALARKFGVTMFSSPFDETAVDFLETLGCPAYKIASFEAMDLPLVRKAASTGKPLIISTGMIGADEIDAVVAAARDTGRGAPALLHCVSSYPAPIDDCNLQTIPALAETYGVTAGLSDHTPGTAVAVAATALGADLIEKHFCLSRAEGGVDSAFSMEPDEMASLVVSCKQARAALGAVKLGRQASADESVIFRRSVYVVADVKKGEAFTQGNIRSIRPGFGLPPAHLPDLLGKKAARSLRRGSPLQWSDVEGPDGGGTADPDNAAAKSAGNA